MIQTDDELMARVGGTDPTALTALFERHHRALFRFFVRLGGSEVLAEDLAQEVFFRMLKFRVSFRAGMRFRPWMYQIARHVHADQFRKRNGEVPLPELVEFRDGAPSAESALIRSGELDTLRRALARLPADRREVLILSRWQNLSYEEIGEIMDCDPGTVKTRVYRAMQQLSKMFHGMSGRKVS